MYKQGVKLQPATIKRNKSSEGVQLETIEDVNSYKIMPIEDRGITLNTAKAFGVRTKLDDKYGKTPVAIYFPYSDENGELCGYKKRDLTKGKKDKGHFTVVGRVDAECQLFGTKTAKKTGGTRIFITEGEFDAMAAWQAIRTHSTLKEKPSVVSIGLGTANAVKHIGQKKNLQFINKFDKTILAFDNDSATPEEKAKGIKKGQEATADVYDLLPEIMVADLPEGSDPCDMLKNQSLEELFWSLWKPTRYTPQGFVRFEDIREQAIEMPVLGRPWPWPSMTKKTLGRREAEGIYLGAGVKMGKCVDPKTKVRMHDGSVKMASELQEGDLLLGWDSKPRKVLELSTGTDRMYDIVQKKGCSYRVNSRHMMLLRDAKKGNALKQIPLNDLVNKDELLKSIRDLKGFHVAVDYNEQNVNIPAYEFGIWLGDGHNGCPRISMAEKDFDTVRDSCTLELSKHVQKNRPDFAQGSFIGTKDKWPSLEKSEGIPDCYLINSKSIRQELLAGLIDSDGHKVSNQCFEISTKYSKLAKDLVMLGRSLGIRVTSRKVTKGIKSLGFEGEYYRVFLCGNMEQIKPRLPRKKQVEVSKRNPTNTGIDINYVGVGPYVCVTTDGDSKFCLEDYTVIHNSTALDKMVEHITTKEFIEWREDGPIEGIQGEHWEWLYYDPLDGTVYDCMAPMNKRIAKKKVKLKNGEKIPQKVALFKFEEQPAETLKKVAGKMYKRDFVNPEKIIFINQDGKEHDVWGDEIPENLRHTFYTKDDLEKAIDGVGENIVLYNNYGRCAWDELKGAIRHAVLVEGVKDVFIDPITRLTSGMTAAEANTELERFADEISKMSQDLGFTYYCFCHLKAPDFGAPHEEGGRVRSTQIRGSRAMMQACHYIFGLEGNKSEDVCERVQNTRYIRLLEDRKHGRTGLIALFYDVDTGDFVEPPEGFLDQDDDDPNTAQTLIEWNELWPNGYEAPDNY